MKFSSDLDNSIYKHVFDASSSVFIKPKGFFVDYREKDLFFDKDKISSSFGSDIKDEAAIDGLVKNSSSSIQKDASELNLMMRFIYKQLISDDFSYGDDTPIKYVVEDLFRHNGASAEMAFINMASSKIYISDSDVIEKFFALTVSIDDELIRNIINPIILMFSSSRDESAAEGALILLEKYGKSNDDLLLAEKIRDFDYAYLNDYKRDVINSLKEKAK